MGRILTEQNLMAYTTWRGRPWGVADMIYERLPMLAVRNYLSSDEEGRNWPLCWTAGRCVRLGLALCIEFLKNWQAFRPGAARTIQSDLERVTPGVVMRFQKGVVRKMRARDIVAASGKEKTTDQLTEMMCQAVARISALKRVKHPTPMLGSKVMHFFFPEFFPVWDTAYVKKALSGLSRKGEIELALREEARFDGKRKDKVAHEYRRYVKPLAGELRDAADLEQLREKLVRYAINEYNDKFLRELAAQSIGNLTPILFELCLIGYGRRKGVL